MPHESIPILVCVDIDVGIAHFIKKLNLIEGVRTHACCQGSLGEGGALPYPAYVMVSWNNDKAKEKLEEFGLLQEGEFHGTCYPSDEVLANELDEEGLEEAA